MSSNRDGGCGGGGGGGGGWSDASDAALATDVAGDAGNISCSNSCCCCSSSSYGVSELSGGDDAFCAFGGPNKQIQLFLDIFGETREKTDK